MHIVNEKTYIHNGYIGAIDDQYHFYEINLKKGDIIELYDKTRIGFSAVRLHCADGMVNTNFEIAEATLHSFYNGKILMYLGFAKIRCNGVIFPIPVWFYKNKKYVGWVHSSIISLAK